MSMISPLHKPEKSGSVRHSLRSRFDYSTVQIKCSFCHNTFYARPVEAVCPKCERCANRDLPQLWRLLSLLLPPLGMAYALCIRAHSPVAAWQGLGWAWRGSLIWVGLWLVMTWERTL